MASVLRQETWHGFRNFFGRHGDSADTRPFPGQLFEEFAHLAGTTPMTRPWKDAFARFSPGASRLVLEGLSDQVAKGDQFALRAILGAAPQGRLPLVLERRARHAGRLPDQHPRIRPPSYV